MSYATLYRNLPPVVLASASPRRAQLLHEMGIAFEVFVPRIDERSIKAPSNVLARVLAEEKCLSAQNTHPSAANKLFVAADTIVLLDGKRLDKPKDANQAKDFLRQLAGRSHEVYTGVALRINKAESAFQTLTTVSFAKLTEREIDYYVTTAAPLDKAGAYGIQEWIGLIGIERIEGSYSNVMGLPTADLHRALLNFGCDCNMQMLRNSIPE